MTTNSVTTNRNLEQWLTTAVMSLIGFALITHIFILSGPVSAINSIMVMAGTLMALLSPLLYSPAGDTPSPTADQRTSAQISLFTRKSGTSSGTDRCAA